MKEATKSLLFNGSWYYDNTAYQAIMNVSKEVERMGMRSDYQDGDIVEVTKQNGVTEEFLLLRCHEGYATAAILKERAPAENSVAVISRQKMYLDAGRPCYVFYDAIGQYVKTLNASELERIRKKIGGSLGIAIPENGETKQPDPVKSINQEEIKDLVEKVTNMMEPLQAAVDKLQNTFDDVGMTLEKEIRLEAERDIFKALYEKERAV